MKRPGFLLIIFLMSLLLAACGWFEPNDLNNEEIVYTDVEYSEDGKNVTIYLDGPAPVPASRALSKSLAILGHDFFEVVFRYNNGSTYITARGNWELGEPAGVSGVYRPESGADYGAGINTTLTNNTGTAILFAGKKSDKTLLAVGALTNAVNSAGTSTGTVIGPDTRSVSFALNALKAGAITAADPVTATSSIMTDARSGSYGSSIYFGGASAMYDRTEIRNLGIQGRIFPAYVIPITKSGGDNRTRLHYIVDVAANVSGYTPPSPITTGSLDGSVSNHFEYYRKGIVYAEAPGSPLSSPWYIENIEPHFTEVDSDGVVHVQKADYSIFTWHHPSTSPVSFYVGSSGSSSMGKGEVFFNPTRIVLSPAGGTDNYIFSFAFQIPVNALSVDNNPVTWFIRNAYDEYIKELDNGNNGSGGAILIAIGSIAAPQTPWLEITRYPRTQYNPGNGGYNFKVDENTLLLKFHTGNGSEVSELAWNDGKISYAYSIDGDSWTPILNGNSLPVPGTGSPPVPDDQEYTVRVRYTPDPVGSPLVYYDAIYTIMVSTTNGIDPGQIGSGNRFVISSSNSWTQFINSIQNSSRQGIYLAVFSTSFNIPQTTLNITGDFTLIITANQPGVTIGRQGTGNVDTFVFNGPGTVLVFMGKWPFDEPVMAGGDILIDYPFRVSARDTYQNFPAGTAITAGLMCRKGTGTGTLSVKAPGVNINNTVAGDTTFRPYVPISP